MSQMILKRRRLSWPAIRLNGWPLLLPALIVLLWHIAAVERWMPEQILPAPAVVAESTVSLKTMSVASAVMALDMTDEPLMTRLALLFDGK